MADLEVWMSRGAGLDLIGLDAESVGEGGGSIHHALFCMLEDAVFVSPCVCVSVCVSVCV